MELLKRVFGELGSPEEVTSLIDSYTDQYNQVVANYAREQNNLANRVLGIARQHSNEALAGTFMLGSIAAGACPDYQPDVQDKFFVRHLGICLGKIDALSPANDLEHF